jgi:hypothetical protein
MGLFDFDFGGGADSDYIDELERKRKEDEAARIAAANFNNMISSTPNINGLFDQQLDKQRQQARSVGASIGKIGNTVGKSISNPKEMAGPPIEDIQSDLTDAELDDPGSKVGGIIRRQAEMSKEPPIGQPIEDIEDFSPIEKETKTSPTEDALQSYKDWASRRPTTEQYKPSLGRKILAGLAGVLAGAGGGPAAAVKMQQAIIGNKYRNAMVDWETEGKALEPIGELSKSIENVGQRRETSKLAHETGMARVGATMEGVKQRSDTEAIRHSDRMAELMSKEGSDAERRAEVSRHNKAVEAIARETNQIRKTDAETRRKTSEAYSSRVDALNKGGGKGKKGSPLPSHYRKAVQDTTNEVLATQRPEMRKYFRQGPSGEIFLRPGQKLQPEEAQKLQAFLDDMRKKAKERLDIEDDNIEEYSPLRGDIQ